MRHDHLRNWACDAIKIKFRNLGSWTGKVWLLNRDAGGAGVTGAEKAEDAAGVVGAFVMPSDADTCLNDDSISDSYQDTCTMYYDE
jgi:hypothetical protein